MQLDLLRNGKEWRKVDCTNIATPCMQQAASNHGWFEPTRYNNNLSFKHIREQSACTTINTKDERPVQKQPARMNVCRRAVPSPAPGSLTARKTNNGTLNTITSEFADFGTERWLVCQESPTKDASASHFNRRIFAKAGTLSPPSNLGDSASVVLVFCSKAGARGTS